MKISFFDRAKHIAQKKKKKPETSICLQFPQCFQKVYSSGKLKLEVVLKKVEMPTTQHYPFVTERSDFYQNPF